MGLIPEQVIDEVQSRSDIVDVVSSYVPLKRSGANFKALCPFHREKTPSFMVSPSKQIWHCFGCSQGGNVVNFVMKYENLQFPEAVRSLAKRAGINIPETPGISREARSKQKVLYEINELAAEYYRANLLDQNIGRAAREYLKRREIGDETSQRFRLGYAPDRWEGFLTYAKRAGWSEGELVQAGLILPGKEGTYYDRFRNKLIFPIQDVQGRVIGFGSRVLDDSLPKYTNSPETDVFRKGRNLYGLNFAKEHTRVDNFIIIVEGYMDCLTLYQNGIRNVVASLGTALTQDQVRLLKRFIQTVVMVYDSDQAGEAASLRGLDLLIEEDLRCRVVRLTKGFDPDDYVRNKGRDGFQGLLRDAPDLFDYKLGLLASRYDSSKVEDVAKITAEMLPTISRITNAVLRSGYIKELAKRLAVDEEAVLVELRKVKGSQDSYYEPQVQQPSPMRSEEKTLIRLMLEDRHVGIIVKDNVASGDFQDPRARKVVACIFESIAQGRSYDPSRLMSHVGDDDVSQLISRLLARPDEFLDRMKVASDCIERMREARSARKRAFLQREIKLAEVAGDEAKVMELLREFQDKNL